MGLVLHHQTADAALGAPLDSWKRGGYLFCGDSLLWMAKLIEMHGEGWIDVVQCDPPYGIEFLRDWDSFKQGKRTQYIVSQEHMGGYAEEKGFTSGLRFANQTPRDMLNYQEFTFEWASLAFRLCKPGARLVSFSSTRTYHHMAVAIEAAGWEIIDKGEWVYWSGFTKSHDYGEMLLRRYELGMGLRGPRKGMPPLPAPERVAILERLAAEILMWIERFAPALRGMPWDQAWPHCFEFYKGRGHALKPAHEPFTIARKPTSEPLHLAGFWLNIDRCRIPYSTPKPKGGLADHLQEPDGEVQAAEIQVHYPHCSGDQWHNDRPWLKQAEAAGETVTIGGHPDGRFPTNMVIERDILGVPDGAPPEEQFSGDLTKNLYGTGARAEAAGYTEVETDYLAPPPGEKPKDALSHDFAQHGGSMMDHANRDEANQNAHAYKPHEDGRYPVNLVLSSQVEDLERDHFAPPEEDLAARKTPLPVNAAYQSPLGTLDGSAETPEEQRAREWQPHPDGKYPPNVLLSGQIRLSDGTMMAITADLLMEMGLEYLAAFLPDLLDDEDGRYPVNMYRCPKPSEAEHGSWNKHVTIKPEGLMRWLATLLANPAEHGAPPNIVLDPFSGSGPVAKVCEEMGLRWIAGDLDPSSCAWTTMRLRRLSHERIALPPGMQRRIDLLIPKRKKKLARKQEPLSTDNHQTVGIPALPAPAALTPAPVDVSTMPLFGGASA